MGKKSEIILYGILFVILLFYTATSIHEFLARDNYQVFLKSEINRIENIISDNDNNLTGIQIDSLKRSLNKLNSLEKDLNDLVEFGSGPLGLKIRKLRHSYYQEFNRLDKDVPYKDQPLSFLWFFILTWPNDILIIFTIIICGAIGAIIRAFIFQLDIKVYKLAIGIAAAFISFFAIKSGNFVFLETESAPSKLNPYTISVLAVLSGLFSEKVFNYFKNKFFADKNTGK